MRSTAKAGEVYLSVGIPQKVAFAGADAILKRNLAGLGIVGILALVATWVGSDLFVLRQVNALVRLTQRLAAGDLGTRAGHPGGKSELSQLARAFDEMAGSLQLRHQQHQSLREIELAVNSTLDLRAVLDVLLDKIDLLLPYSAATLRLFNRETGDLESFASRNLNEEEWKAQVMQSLTDRPKRGLANLVFETQTPLMVPNAQTDPRTREPAFFRKHGLVSYLGIPLIAKGEALGVLSFYTKQEHTFSDEEVEFLSTLAGQAAVAIHNSQLYEQTKKQAVDLRKREEVQKLLKELSQDITSLDINTLLKKLTGKVREFLRVDISDVRVLVKGNWQVIGVSGIAPELVQSYTGTSRGRSKWIIETRKPVLIPDITKHSGFSGESSVRKAGIRGYLGIPLISRDGEVIGILRALSYQPREFNQEEVDLLEQLANGAAIAIENTRLYDAIKNQTVELEKANKLKSEFLSVMSHELRTPVNVILGYTEMIKDGTLGEINSKQEERLGRIKRYSEDLLRMISGLLEATRIEAGVAKVESYELNLYNFLNELRSAYEVPLNKELTLIWDYSSELPVIRTDSQKLKHILQNLINNAIKFTDKGSVTITARYLLEAKAVLFNVADTGVGIPKESLPTIFEMFRQVDSSETRVHGGVGIGLYIVKKFTELLGGIVEVESEPGKGSTFTVTIPDGRDKPERFLAKLGAADDHPSISPRSGS